MLDEDVERVNAMRSWVGPDVALMADANMRWGVDEAITAARALRARGPGVAGRAHHPRRRDRARAHREGGRCAHRDRGESALHLRVRSHDRERRRRVPRARRRHRRRRDTLARHRPKGEGSTTCRLPPTGCTICRSTCWRPIPNASYLEVHGFGLDALHGGPARDPRRGGLRPADEPGHGVELDWPALESRSGRLPVAHSAAEDVDARRRGRSPGARWRWGASGGWAESASAAASSATKPTPSSPLGIPVARMSSMMRAATTSPASSLAASRVSAPRHAAASRCRSGAPSAVKRNTAGAVRITLMPWGTKGDGTG